MKIGDECWIVVGHGGHHHEVLYDNLGEAQGWCCDSEGDQAVRVRIVPADEWQTMESAPKDGTEVWVFQRDTFGDYQTAAFCEDDCWYDAMYNRPMDPTHWRPLLPGPEVK